MLCPPPPRFPPTPHPAHRPDGLVVKAPASRTANPEFDSVFLRGDFSGSRPASELKIGTPVATLPGEWRYRVSAGTGWPGVNILRLGEIESLICSLYLSVAARAVRSGECGPDPAPSLQDSLTQAVHALRRAVVVCWLLNVPALGLVGPVSVYCECVR